ncbi:MAG: HAD-IG family 5'-nucleotidase [Deltaproteobacteria bacterium]|nr:HAD-IG family 5'-nucleotidase [Deltaproteobacteria bacterium]
MSSVIAAPPPGRGLYCNRTLNLKSIRAIGYDMDYTLVHYRVAEWETRAYEFAREKLLAHGWPVGDLSFDPTAFTRGLVLDLELGNVVKANRFGYVKQGCHGMRALSLDDLRATYARTIVDLAQPRWLFLNTLFSLSEACLYLQLVDLLDARALPGVLGYGDLYKRVKASLDEAHMEGELKAEVMADPDRYIEPDPDTVLALLDQKHAGKKLLLITNSEWSYTSPLMTHCFDRYMPAGSTWRDLFDVVIVSARKPEFFSTYSPLLEVVDPSGLLRPANALVDHAMYFGGNARQVERYLGLVGDQILYVGDHIYGDVHVSHSILRWRTALIVRELEEEVAAVEGFRAEQIELDALMRTKVALEREKAVLRTTQQRRAKGYGPEGTQSDAEVAERVNVLRAELAALDERIGPYARRASHLGNARWGLLMRAGNDKSHLARQIERRADVYTSRVSNFLFETPHAFVRSLRGSLPHDPAV